MTDQEKAQQLLDRIDRRICLPERECLERVRDGMERASDREMFTQLATEFAADLK